MHVKYVKHKGLINFGSWVDPYVHNGFVIRFTQAYYVGLTRFKQA